MWRVPVTHTANAVADAEPMLLPLLGYIHTCRIHCMEIVDHRDFTQRINTWQNPQQLVQIILCIFYSADPQNNYSVLVLCCLSAEYLGHVCVLPGVGCISSWVPMPRGGG